MSAATSSLLILSSLKIDAADDVLADAVNREKTEAVSDYPIQTPFPPWRCEDFKEGDFVNPRSLHPEFMLIYNSSSAAGQPCLTPFERYRLLHESKMFYEAYLLKQVKYNLSLFVIPAAMALLVQPFKCASVMAHFLLTRFSESEQSNLPLPAPGQSSLSDHPVFTLQSQGNSTATSNIAVADSRICCVLSDRGAFINELKSIAPDLQDGTVISF